MLNRKFEIWYIFNRVLYLFYLKICFIVVILIFIFLKYCFLGYKKWIVGFDFKRIFIGRKVERMVYFFYK